MSKFDKEQILRTSGVNVLKCMRCGKCSATCPSYDEMEYHPHQFVYMVEKGEIDKADEFALYLQVSFLLCVHGALSPRCGAGEGGRGGAPAGDPPAGRRTT